MEHTRSVWKRALTAALPVGLVLAPLFVGGSACSKPKPLDQTDVAGTLAATGDMYIHGLFALLVLASFSGDNTNYWIGRFVGPRVFSQQQSWALNPAHLERTRRFYERHGYVDHDEWSDQPSKMYFRELRT